jgi:hypothetical protein
VVAVRLHGPSAAQFSDCHRKTRAKFIFPFSASLRILSGPPWLTRDPSRTLIPERSYQNAHIPERSYQNAQNQNAHSLRYKRPTGQAYGRDCAYVLVCSSRESYKDATFALPECKGAGHVLRHQRASYTLVYVPVLLACSHDDILYRIN